MDMNECSLSRKEAMRLRNASVKMREEAAKLYGSRCINCGAEDVHWHHVVPIYVGGINAASNLVPLCQSCHYLVHHGVRLDRSKLKRMSGGCPQRRFSNEEIEIARQVVFSEIPANWGGKKLGWKHASKALCLRVAEKFGVIDYRNNLGCRLSFRGEINPGDEVGWVKMSDGKIKNIYATRKHLPSDYDITIRHPIKNEDAAS